MRPLSSRGGGGQGPPKKHKFFLWLPLASIFFSNMTSLTSKNYFLNRQLKDKTRPAIKATSHPKNALSDSKEQDREYKKVIILYVQEVLSVKMNRPSWTFSMMEYRGIEDRTEIRQQDILYFLDHGEYSILKFLNALLCLNGLLEKQDLILILF